MSVLVEQLESGNQADPSYLYIAKVLGSIPFRSDGEYVVDMRMGLEKVDTLSLVCMSMALRLNTDVPTAILPVGVLASSKKVTGSSFFAWNTISVLVETDGGIVRAMTSSDTVLVAVLEALTSLVERTSDIPVQPAVLKEVEVDIVVTRSALVDLTLYEYVLQERRLDRVTVWLVTRGEVSLSTVLVPNEVVSPYSTWLEAAAEEVQVMVAVLVLAVLETEVRRRGAELKTKILLPDLFDT